MMQAQNRVANIYQTDLDRHLYAFEKREPVLAGLTDRPKEWAGGMARWRTALAGHGFFSKHGAHARGHRGRRGNFDLVRKAAV